jgi:hypothetical protein
MAQPSLIVSLSTAHGKRASISSNEFALGNAVKVLDADDETGNKVIVRKIT